jgi:Fic family protein
VNNLDDWFRVELTYTSNAIEGNTLTRSETALVVEKGLTVEGKRLDELLEATNHAHALDYIRGLATGKPQDFTKLDLLNIHRLILESIDDENAGRYRRVGVRITGSLTTPPEPVIVPELMEKFINQVHDPKAYDHPAQFVAAMHHRLVVIHPFIDGNGRTARLLMNLLLMQAGYPPAIIRPEDRRAYIDAIEAGERTGRLDSFYDFIARAIERSLDLYLEAVTGRRQSMPVIKTAHDLVNRKTLAELSGVRPSTLKHYSDIGILPYHQAGEGLMRRYGRAASVERLDLILQLRDQGLSLEEIGKRLGATVVGQ